MPLCEEIDLASSSICVLRRETTRIQLLELAISKAQHFHSLWQNEMLQVLSRS